MVERRLPALDDEAQHFEENRRAIVFLQYCKSCKRKHYMTHQPCSGCNVYTVPQPVSDKVADRCYADYRCDGCYTYETDHLA